jgi:hypothetical protein
MTSNEMRALGDLFQALGEGMGGTESISPEVRAKYEAQRDAALKVLSLKPKAFLCEGACDTTTMHNLVNGMWQCEMCGYRVKPVED